MRKFIAGLFAFVFVLSVAGAANACPFMGGGKTEDTKKESVGA